MYFQSGCTIVVIYGNCECRFVRFSIFILKIFLGLSQSKDARKAVVVSMGLASEVCCLHGYLKPHPLARTAGFFLMPRIRNMYLPT